ncbi:MAG: cytochrome c [Nitrospinae bacterium]|nr:cytochrome c [Nitrospinota bacterium]
MGPQSFYKPRQFVLILLNLLLMAPTVAQGWPWNTDMFDQPSVKPQESPRRPPAQSIPVQGRERVLDRKVADQALVNPVAVTPESIERGKLSYQLYCAPCHGLEGRGNGPVSKKFIPPPDLHPILPKRTDGYLYATIRSGGPIMPSYGVQLPSQERWDVVNYLRQFQEAPRR